MPHEPCTPDRPAEWPDYSGPRCRRCRCAEGLRGAANRGLRAAPNVPRRPHASGRGVQTMADLRSVVLAGGGTGGLMYTPISFAECAPRLTTADPASSVLR